MGRAESNPLWVVPSKAKPAPACRPNSRSGSCGKVTRRGAANRHAAAIAAGTKKHRDRSVLRVIRLSFQQSGRRDSNPRRSAWKADALPLSYARARALPNSTTPIRPHPDQSAAPRTPNHHPATRHDPRGTPRTCSNPHQSQRSTPRPMACAMGRAGLEPATPAFSMRCSTN